MILPAVTAYTVVEAVDPGMRVRVTWPDGTQRAGVVGVVRLGRSGQYCTHDGIPVDGSYNYACTVEAMGTNGRYATIWDTVTPQLRR